VLRKAGVSRCPHRSWKSTRRRPGLAIDARIATTGPYQASRITLIDLCTSYAPMSPFPTGVVKSSRGHESLLTGSAQSTRASTRPPSFFPFEHTFVTNGRSVVDRKRQTQNALLTTLIPTFTLPTRLIRASATANLPSPNLLAECVLVSVSTTLLLPYT
jgi:hypothetical protein